MSRKLTIGLLLIEQLRSPARAEFAMALRTARELKGRDVTEALANELDRSGTDHEQQKKNKY